MEDRGWYLVMALWGAAYGGVDVNRLARAVRAQSPDCAGAIVLIDRRRADIDPWVRQAPFPADFARPECFGPGYVAKLAMFAPEVAPPGTRCVYLDLDTLVLGDMGRLADCVDGPEAMLMLPPASPLGFGAVRRWLFRRTGGRRMATGNSSVMAWHSDAAGNIAQHWRAIVARGPTPAEAACMGIDDVFISWSAQMRLRGVPSALAVPFRRAFLSRAPGWLRKALRPWRRRRQAGLVAVTFNGANSKPATLARLPEGAEVADGRGRRARWCDSDMGQLRAAVLASWGAGSPDTARQPTV